MIPAVLKDAESAVRGHISMVAPTYGIVLGSGLGGLAERIAGQTRISYGEIPGFEETGVVGHAGQLIHGTLGDEEIIALAGRFHMYEGHDAATAAFPIRLLHALGARILVVSNAAGGVRRTFAAGDLMAIADHINLTARNPLIGAVSQGDERFPDMSQAYDAELRQELHAVARDLGILLHDGVYCGLTGPSYETPAEVRMLERIGADAVGMSTVAEVIAARAMGMRVLGVSCIANPAAGLSLDPLTHDDVMRVTRRAGEKFVNLIERWIAHRSTASGA